MKNLKKFLSVILCTLMLCSILPVYCIAQALDTSEEITSHVNVIEHYRPVHQWVYPWETVDGNDSTKWYPETPSGTDYASLTYEFDGVYNIDYLRCLICGESGGSGKYNVYAYVNESWSLLAQNVDSMSSYKQVSFDSVATTKIKIEFPVISFRYALSVCEVEFYGSYAGSSGDDEHTHAYTNAVVTAPTATTMGYTTYKCSCGLEFSGKYVKATGVSSHILSDVDKLIGINGVMSDTAAQLSCANYYREYHTWLWTYSNGETNFTRANNRYKNMDEYYLSLKNAGMEIVPCLQQSSTNPTPSTNVNDYMDYARHAYQYAAHYGSNTNVDVSSVNFSSYDNPTVGLGYINYLEIGNENNATYTAQQYAAMLSAAYDGHCGTMGAGIGAKNADPNIKIVMQGTAGIPVQYIKDMIDWCKENRADHSLPFDVFNGHSYLRKEINAANVGYVNVGISPEEGNIGEVLSELIALRDSEYPDMEVWFTEFGWDTNQTYAQLGQNAMAYGDYTGRQVQAMWLARAYLILSSLGVDKAAMYMCKDTGAEDTTVGMYGTSGVVTVDGQYKDSYYYISTLKNKLAGMKFIEEVDSGNSDLFIYKFADGNGKECYALWCPTSDGTKYDNYSFAVNGTNVKLVQMANGQINGNETSLTPSNGTVSVNVSECPILVMTEQVTEPVIEQVNISSVLSSSSTTGTVRYGNAASVYDGTIPTGSWQSSAIAFSGNGSVTLNFSNALNISSLEVYTNAGVQDTVKVKIEYLNGSTWTLLEEKSIASSDRSVEFGNIANAGGIRISVTHGGLYFGTIDEVKIFTQTN